MDVLTGATGSPATSAKARRLGAHVYVLSLALAVIAAAASALTFFVPGILLGPAVSNGNARGTALVILVLAIPVLLLAMWFERRGSWRAVFVWLGALFYLGYNAFLFLFLTPFNSLFLLYITFQSLALFSTLALVRAVDPGRTIELDEAIAGEGFGDLRLDDRRSECGGMAARGRAGHGCGESRIVSGRSRCGDQCRLCAGPCVLAAVDDRGRMVDVASTPAGHPPHGILAGVRRHGIRWDRGGPVVRTSSGSTVSPCIRFRHTDDGGARHRESHRCLFLSPEGTSNDEQLDARRP